MSVNFILSYFIIKKDKNKNRLRAVFVIGVHLQPRSNLLYGK